MTIESRGKFKMAASRNLHRIVFLFILLMRRRRRRMRAACRTIWSRTWIQRRQRHGIFVNLLRELEEEDPTIRSLSLNSSVALTSYQQG